jgi:parvulin-like peptidyl-prolyl isomerase
MQGFMVGIGLAALLMVFQANADNPDSAADQGSIFAQIDDLTISKDEFEAIFQSAVRYKYFHGKVPQEDIVTQQLVYNQALKLGLQPDREKINEGVDAFDLQNINNPEWQARREKVLDKLVAKMERQDLIEKLEASVRDIPLPDASAVRQFYLDNPEKFTEPERRRVSVILFKVPPYAAEDEWLEAEAELASLKQRVESGEDFAALAKKYSGHASAASGGDLGFLHQGVLEPVVQQKVEALELDQLTDPIRVLEGITLFQLNGIQSAELKAFSEVKERAADLLYRELQDSAWESYLNSLRSSAKVHVYE